MAKKRHMPFPPTSTQVHQNPYITNDMHVKKTIEIATSIVHNVYSQAGDRAASLLPLLEQLCILLTPTDVHMACQKAINQTNRDPPSGASYDSSIAAIAANSLLSQVVEVTFSQRKNLAFLLADALAKILCSTANTPDATLYHSTQIKAAIVLNQLAATEPPPPIDSSFDQEQFSPYGHPQRSSRSEIIASTPTSWCHVIVHSGALPTLVQHIPPLTDGNIKSNMDLVFSPGSHELAEKCVWVIGNLSGESEIARGELQRMGALPRLIRNLCTVMQQRSNHQFEGLVKASVWTCINLFREGGLPATDFLDMHNSMQGTRLTLMDLVLLLSSPEKFSSSTWKDVAIETCWLLSFLTRESTLVVDFLCQKREQGEKANVISMLVFRLARATDETSQHLNSTGSGFVQDMGCLMSCCRALKNVALASDGLYIQSIFQDNISCAVGAAESSIAKLISMGSLGAGSEITAIATEAVALAGACLYAVGVDHPIPHYYQTFLPALCQTLTCVMSTFEFKRELVWALWSAAYLRPDFCETKQSNVAAEQTKILMQIIHTSPNEIAAALTGMLSTLDSDVLDASVHLVDVLLRRIDSASQRLKTIFEEAGLVDALWRVCDHYSEDNPTTELAAGILDDFYEQEEEELDGSSETVTDFQFRPQPIQGGFNFDTTASLQQVPPSLGRGRGRERIVPAWMQQ